MISKNTPVATVDEPFNFDLFVPAFGDQFVDFFFNGEGDAPSVGPEADAAIAAAQEETISSSGSETGSSVVTNGLDDGFAGITTGAQNIVGLLPNPFSVGGPLTNGLIGQTSGLATQQAGSPSSLPSVNGVEFGDGVLVTNPDGGFFISAGPTDDLLPSDSVNKGNTTAFNIGK